MRIAPMLNSLRGPDSNVLRTIFQALRFTGAGLSVKQYTGFISGGGNATITHSLPDLPSRVVSVNGYYKDAGGNAVPITTPTVGATTITITGGASTAYRITVSYDDRNVW